jgi:hypothetical protein
MGWSPERFAQHQSRFPSEQRAQRNRQAQARYRESHAIDLATARKLMAILTRQSGRADDMQQLADLLRQRYREASLRQLRVELGPKRQQAAQKEAVRRERELWMREHPGRTSKDYNKLTTDELVAWRKAKAAADRVAEQQAWAHDHPGEPWPEYLCQLGEADYVKHRRWDERRRKGKRRQDVRE